MKKNLKYIIIIAIGLIIIIFGHYTNRRTLTYAKERNSYNRIKVKEEKFYIDSIAELAKFYSIFGTDLKINPKYVVGNTVFVQLKTYGVLRDSVKIKEVSLDNNRVEIVEDRDETEVGLTVQSPWYLVAIVPDNKLEGVNLDDWVKPSEAISNLENEAID